MEDLTIRGNRGFTAPQWQGAGKVEKLSGREIQTADRGTGLNVSETLRQLMDRTGLMEGLESRRTLQLGEGVLAEVQEKLGRMAELVREAAGAGAVDRAGLQAELEQLRDEVGRMLDSAAAGGVSLFSDEAVEKPADGVSAGQEAAIPDWLAKAVAQADPSRLLSALGLDSSATGADIVAALAGRSLESDPAAGCLAALYLGAVISGATRSGDLNQAIDGLCLLLEKTSQGIPLDKAIEQLTGGEYASLADFQEQFTGGTIPGLDTFLANLLLSDSGELILDGQTLLDLMAGLGGLDMDLMLMLLDAGQVQASALGAGQEAELAAAAGEAGTLVSGAAAEGGESQPMAVMQFGEVQVMGRDLSGVSYDTATGQLTIGGTADVVVQGTGQKGEQAILVTGSGTVTVQDVKASSLAVDAPDARIVTVGRNTLDEVTLKEGTTLTLEGRGMLRAGTFRGGESTMLHLTGGAVAVTDGNGETLGTLTVPVLIDGAASLAAQANFVRDMSGTSLEPFDLVWKLLLPGFSVVNSMTLDGQQARMSLQGENADPARLWLAKGDLSAHGYPAHTLELQGRDEVGRPRTRYAYLRWDRRMRGFQEISMYPNPFTVTGGEQDQDWFYDEESHTLHILSGQVTAVSGGAGTSARQEPFSGRIALFDRIGALELALGGVVCRVSSGRAFQLGRENDVTLVLRSGTNNLFESGAGCAGISLGEGTSLRIDCTPPQDRGEPVGMLVATGGTGCVGIGQDRGGSRGRPGHIMIRGGMATGGEKPGSAGSVTIVGSASAGGASAGSDLGSARTWARMGLFLQLGEDAVILPQFPLSSRTLQLNKLRVSTREYARAARMTIDADRRWVSQIQTAYNTLSSHLEQNINGPVRDNTSASVLLREVARSAPILSDRAMQVRSLQSLRDVNRLLR